MGVVGAGSPRPVSKATASWKVSGGFDTAATLRLRYRSAQRDAAYSTTNVSLICILKILHNQIRNICRCVLAEDAEEIGGGGDFAILLFEIILNECEERFIAHACAQVLQKVRAVEINLIPIRALTFSIVDAYVHLFFRFIRIKAIRPPPIAQCVG